MKEDYVLSHISDAAFETAASGPGAMTASVPVSSDNLLALIENSLDDDKAEDIVAIPLKGKSSASLKSSLGAIPSTEPSCLMRSWRK